MEPELLRTELEKHLRIKMDYKVYLKSQYLTKRICELTNRPHEIGFLYGGNHTNENNTNTVDISDIYVPLQQYVQPAHFQFQGGISNAHSTFAQKQKKVIGLGHSHADFPVFHSAEDHKNLRRLVITEGSPIHYTIVEKKQYKILTEKNKVTRLENYKLHRRPISRPPVVQSTIRTKRQRRDAFKYFRRKKQPIKRQISSNRPKIKHNKALVFPSLVYNIRNDFHSGTAVFTDGFQMIEKTPISFYNKDAKLSVEEKKELDSYITRILEYNNLPIHRELLIKCENPYST